MHVKTSAPELPCRCEHKQKVLFLKFFLGWLERPKGTKVCTQPTVAFSSLVQLARLSGLDVDRPSCCIRRSFIYHLRRFAHLPRICHLPHLCAVVVWSFRLDWRFLTTTLSFVASSSLA